MEIKWTDDGVVSIGGIMDVHKFYVHATDIKSPNFNAFDCYFREIKAWLEQNVEDRRYDTLGGILSLTILIMDPEPAMLFKLAWME